MLCFGSHTHTKKKVKLNKGGHFGNNSFKCQRLSCFVSSHEVQILSCIRYHEYQGGLESNDKTNVTHLW